MTNKKSTNISHLKFKLRHDNSQSVSTVSAAWRAGVLQEFCRVLQEFCRSSAGFKLQLKYNAPLTELHV